MSSPLTVCLPTSDRTRAHAFYVALGFETPGDELGDDGVPEPLRVALSGACEVMLIPTGGFGWVTGGAEPVGPEQAEVLLTLSLTSRAEVDERFATATSAGASTVAAPEQKAWGYVAVFADPDGHRWQLLAAD